MKVLNQPIKKNGALAVLGSLSELMRKNGEGAMDDDEVITNSNRLL